MTRTKRVECTVSGRVQMVMYRDFVVRNARRLGVNGVVRNEDDGTVSVVAEGDEKTLHNFIIQLRKGPIFAHVENVHIIWGESTGEFLDFTICY